MAKNVNLDVLNSVENKAAADAALNEIKEVYKDKLDENGEYNIGNNGYFVGQTFVLTGEVVLEDYDVNGNKGKSPKLRTEQGTSIALKSLLGLTSPRGYQFTGSIDEVRKDATEPHNKVVLDCNTTADEYNKIKWQVPTRDLIKLYAAIKVDPNSIKGKTVTYRGIIGRQATAKRTDIQNDRNIGDKYAITSRVWEMSKD